MHWTLRTFVLLSGIRLCLGQDYVFGNVVKAVEDPEQGVSATGVHSFVYFTFSDDYPYTCKCVPRSAGNIVGYCKNDESRSCYLTQDVIDAGVGPYVGLWTFLSFALAFSWQ